MYDRELNLIPLSSTVITYEVTVMIVVRILFYIHKYHNFANKNLSDMEKSNITYIRFILNLIISHNNLNSKSSRYLSSWAFIVITESSSVAGVWSLLRRGTEAGGQL